MPPQMFWLTLPSAVVLALLVFHSYRTLSATRATTFWVAVTVYGVVRGLAVAWITEEGLGGTVPYQLHQRNLTLAGIPLQEVAGWAIVAYLAWFFGSRSVEKLSSSNLYAGILSAALFLASISWCIEASAIAAGWWHWSLPAQHPLFLNVPSIGVVDWAFVAFDFLAPFLLLSSERRRSEWWRWASLLLFPLHFGSHLLIDPPAGWLPIPTFHLVHWTVLALFVWLALRATEPVVPLGRYALPFAAASIIVIDLCLVDLVVARQPALLVTIVPLVLLMALAFVERRSLANGGAVAAAIAGFSHPPFWLSLPAPLLKALFLTRPKIRARLAPATVAALAVLAIFVHSRAAERQERLQAELTAAIADRDAGRLGPAEQRLVELTQAQPHSHVPHAMLAEIYYKTDRLPAARDHYEQAVAIKHDFVDGLKHLAVIAIRNGESTAASNYVRRGQAITPADIELEVLALRLEGKSAAPVIASAESAPRAAALASLLFEAGDTDGTREMLDAALERWPSESRLYRLRVNLALAQKDLAAARLVSARWLQQIPGDAQAAAMADRLAAAR